MASLTTTLALVIGLPQSAQASEITITSIAGKDSSYVTYYADSWTVSICEKTKAAKRGYVQVQSGKKWIKLKGVSKSTTSKDLSQCKKSFPYLTEFTYTESKVDYKKYRVYVPGKSGYKLSFAVAKDFAPTEIYSGSGGGGLYSSKLQGCYFGSKKLAGSVYFSNSQLFSDFTIYESSSSLGSDLSVYLNPSSTFASIASCGEWHIASSEWMADFTVYQTSSPIFADFVVNYVSSSWLAGVN